MAVGLVRRIYLVCVFTCACLGLCWGLDVRGAAFFIFSKREVREHGKRSAEVFFLPVT